MTDTRAPSFPSHVTASYSPKSWLLSKLIARYSLVLETGHSTSDEVLMLIREARRRGVSQIVVTHAMIAPIHMQVAEMKEAAALGAWIEFVYNGLIGPYKEFDFFDYAAAIRRSRSRALCSLERLGATC